MRVEKNTFIKALMTLSLLSNNGCTPRVSRMFDLSAGSVPDYAKTELYVEQNELYETFWKYYETKLKIIENFAIDEEMNTDFFISNDAITRLYEAQINMTTFYEQIYTDPETRQDFIESVNKVNKANDDIFGVSGNDIDHRRILELLIFSNYQTGMIGLFKAETQAESEVSFSRFNDTFNWGIHYLSSYYPSWITSDPRQTRDASGSLLADDPVFNLIVGLSDQRINYSLEVSSNLISNQMINYEESNMLRLLQDGSVASMSEANFNEYLTYVLGVGVGNSQLEKQMVNNFWKLLDKINYHIKHEKPDAKIFTREELLIVLINNGFGFWQEEVAQRLFAYGEKIPGGLNYANQAIVLTNEAIVYQIGNPIQLGDVLINGNSLEIEEHDIANRGFMIPVCNAVESGKWWNVVKAGNGEEYIIWPIDDDRWAAIERESVLIIAETRDDFARRNPLVTYHSLLNSVYDLSVLPSALFTGFPPYFDYSTSGFAKLVSSGNTINTADIMIESFSPTEAIKTLQNNASFLRWFVTSLLRSGY